MQEQISKSSFKAHALEIMRQIEESGEAVVITSHGQPCLVLQKYQPTEENPLQLLRASVLSYENPTGPVADDDWQSA
jgi:antitoxin (DNA-binding transcriptional repressor) of toxin-antitoxin stability system